MSSAFRKGRATSLPCRRAGTGNNGKMPFNILVVTVYKLVLVPRRHETGPDPCDDDTT
jgi:hypothetical protein